MREITPYLNSVVDGIENVDLGLWMRSELRMIFVE